MEWLHCSAAVAAHCWRAAAHRSTALGSLPPPSLMLRLCRHGGKLVPVWSPAPLPTSFSLCVGAAHPHHTHSSLTPLCKEGKLRHGTGNPMLCWGCCALCNIPNSGRPSSSPWGLSGLGGAVRDTKAACRFNREPGASHHLQ